MGRSAIDRSYLSIREVLDLLVDEFPDVTISKIRFLESRGLIHPERTPSGYRKFYEADVDRLRWILRQQREHFLPLKVIKGRLEGSSSDTPSLFDELPAGGEPLAPANRAVDERVEALVAIAAGGEQASKATGTPPDPMSQRGRRRPDEAPAPERTEPPVAASDTSGATGRAASSGPGEPVPQRAADGPGPGVPVSTAAAGEVLGARYGAAELAEAAGLEPELLRELEEYGLVQGREVAGERCYDDEALVVARLAAGFRRFGIESRHLRTFKHAAEREGSLFAQVVMPLLRQRNPAARERAHSQLAELAELGTALVAALVRAELRELTGG